MHTVRPLPTERRFHNNVEIIFVLLYEASLSLSFLARFFLHHMHKLSVLLYKHAVKGISSDCEYSAWSVHCCSRCGCSHAFTLSMSHKTVGHGVRVGKVECIRGRPGCERSVTMFVSLFLFYSGAYFCPRHSHEDSPILSAHSRTHNSFSKHSI
jgi:hypothetical protein